MQNDLDAKGVPMTIRSHRLPSLALALRALLSLAIVAVALAGAGRAAADSKTPPAEKKHCTVKVSDDGAGGATYAGFPHGATMTVKDNDGSGRVRTFRCNDGVWEQVDVVRSRFTTLTEVKVRADGFGWVTLLVAA
jgi:hypothetical protein